MNVSAGAANEDEVFVFPTRMRKTWSDSTYLALQVRVLQLPAHKSN